MISVGITAVGSGIGQAVLDSVRRSSLPMKVVGLEAGAWSKGLYECDDGYSLPLASSVDYPSALIDRCQQAGIDLLIPGSDAELLHIAQLLPQLQDIGTKVVVSSPECVQLCRDKFELAARIRSRRQPFIDTWTLTFSLEHQEELTYPLVIKPRGGSGSLGVQVIFHPDEWQNLKRIDDRDGYVVQPFLMPREWHGDKRQAMVARMKASGQPIQEEEISVQFFVDKDGKIQGQFASVNRLKQGIPIHIAPIDDQSVWDAAHQTAAVLIEMGLRGPVNLQGRITVNGPVFFEINPRFTGITHLRALMGYREVEAAVHHFGKGETGENIRPLLDDKPAQSYVGLRQTTETVVPRIVLDHFQEQGHLSQSPYLKRVLMTGITGYLGQALAMALFSGGITEEIIAPVRAGSIPHAMFKESLRERIRFVEWQSPEYLESELFNNLDLIVHAAAARPGTNTSNADWHRFNVLGTLALVTAARRLHVPRFIFLSSQSVYDTNQTRPWHENRSAILPETPYAHSKIAAEGIVQTLTGSRTRWTILRLARLYGSADTMRWGELPHRFLSLARLGGPISIHGDGSQEMDLLNVNDAVACILRLSKVPSMVWNEIYNVGGGNPISVAALAHLCVELVQARYGTVSPVQYLPIDTPSPSFGMSIERIRSATQWYPETSIQDGLLQLLERLELQS